MLTYFTNSHDIIRSPKVNRRKHSHSFQNYQPDFGQELGSNFDYNWTSTRFDSDFSESRPSMTPTMERKIFAPMGMRKIDSEPRFYENSRFERSKSSITPAQVKSEVIPGA